MIVVTPRTSATPAPAADLADHEPSERSDTDRRPTSRPALGRAAAVVGTATLVASVANYGLNLVLARWLEPAEFGDANLVVTLLLAITAVAVTLQLVAAKRISDAEGDVATVRVPLVRRAWWTGMALAVIGVAGAPVVRELTSSASAVPYVVLALGLPWYLAQSVERGVLQGCLRFGALASTLLVEAAVRLIGALTLVAAGAGVVGASAGISLSFLASWAIARAAVGRPADDAPRVEQRRWSTQDRDATQAASLLLLGQILINNGDVVLAKILLDADSAGVHAVVALVGRAIFFLSWSVVTAAFPMVGDDVGRSIERRATRIVAAVSAVVTGGVAVAAPTVPPLVLGGGYGQAGRLFLPYALATSLFSVANVRASLAAARGERRPGALLIAGGIVQALVLALFATDLISMSWLQVVAMATLLAVVTVERRTAHQSRRAVVTG